MEYLETLSAPSEAPELAARVNERLGYQAVRLGSDVPVCVDGNRKRQAHAQEAWDAVTNLKSKLVSIESARRQFEFSTVGFWRFRKRHRIHVLPGHRVDISDVVEAFEAEKRGRRRVIA